jgi:hypothetical protein
MKQHIFFILTQPSWDGYLLLYSPKSSIRGTTTIYPSSKQSGSIHTYKTKKMAKMVVVCVHHDGMYARNRQLPQLPIVLCG